MQTNAGKYTKTESLETSDSDTAVKYSHGGGADGDDQPAATGAKAAPGPDDDDDEGDDGDGGDDDDGGEVETVSVLLVPLKSGRFLKRVQTQDGKNYRFICKLSDDGKVMFMSLMSLMSMSMTQSASNNNNE